MCTLLILVVNQARRDDIEKALFIFVDIVFHIRIHLITKFKLMRVL